MRMHGCGHKSRAVWPLAMMIGGFGRRWGSDWGADFGSEFGGRGSGGSHRRGPSGRGRMFGSGELRLVLLALIAETPRHGYELIKAIEELAGGAYAPSPGIVYPTISQLLDEERIEEWGDGIASVRRRLMVTEAGQAELDGRTDELEKIIARLKALAEERERHSAPPLKRAIGNLFMAVRSRLGGAESDRETMHQIAEILDEAARKIERI